MEYKAILEIDDQLIGDFVLKVEDGEFIGRDWLSYDKDFSTASIMVGSDDQLICKAVFFEDVSSTGKEIYRTHFNTKDYKVFSIMTPGKAGTFGVTVTLSEKNKKVELPTNWGRQLELFYKETQK